MMFGKNIKFDLECESEKFRTDNFKCPSNEFRLNETRFDSPI